MILLDTDMKNSYICNVFFIVLDLRLMKIGCRETTFPFLNRLCLTPFREIEAIFFLCHHTIMMRKPLALQEKV